MKQTQILKRIWMKPWLIAGLLMISTALFAERSPASPGERAVSFALGDSAPDFHLKDVTTEKTVSRDDFRDKKILLVVVLCRHCPYVQHVKEGVAQLSRDYAGKEVAIVAISANDPAAYPEDSPESLRQMAEEEKFGFPLLFDETQEVAKAYTARATPDFFIFNQERKLVYHGQFDSSRPGSPQPVTGGDVRAVLEALLEDRPVPAGQKHAVGCSIKWKPGNAPERAKS